tara:strand:- start:41 stop:196 length:156 start_codon:yes stop_codon:yes gene_type:complete
MKLEEQEVQEYATWVLEQCCSPLDEIEYLVGMLLQSDKKEDIIKDIKFVVE